MLVAPLDANTLGKVASGICDNLLVSDSLGMPPSLDLTPSLLSADCRCAGFSAWNHLQWTSWLRTQFSGPPRPPIWSHLLSCKWQKAGSWQVAL